VGPPPSGATRRLGVLLAMLLLQLIYTPDTGACQISQLPSIRRGSGWRRFPAKFALPAADVDYRPSSGIRLCLAQDLVGDGGCVPLTEE
jgi:hypothetical protein